MPRQTEEAKQMEARGERPRRATELARRSIYLSPEEEGEQKAAISGKVAGAEAKARLPYQLELEKERGAERKEIANLNNIARLDLADRRHEFHKQDMYEGWDLKARIDVEKRAIAKAFKAGHIDPETGRALPTAEDRIAASMEIEDLAEIQIKTKKEYLANLTKRTQEIDEQRKNIESMIESRKNRDSIARVKQLTQTQVTDRQKSLAHCGA